MTPGQGLHDILPPASKDISPPASRAVPTSTSRDVPTSASRDAATQASRDAPTSASRDVPTLQNDALCSPRQAVTAQAAACALSQASVLLAACTWCDLLGASVRASQASEEPAALEALHTVQYQVWTLRSTLVANVPKSHDAAAGRHAATAGLVVHAWICSV